MVYKREDHHDDKRQCTSSDDGSMKWMPLKMRVVRKMMNSDSYNKAAACRADLHHSNDQKSSANYNGNNDFVRVCSDCNTTKTPLWRGGPQGPKSLCNACGIRQRKARKAMAQAAETGNNRTELDNMEASTTTKMEKKMRTNNVTQKKHVKLIGDHTDHNVVVHSSSLNDEKKLISFDDFALGFIRKRNLTFRDEEEAAILLLALSCGLIHS